MTSKIVIFHPLVWVLDRGFLRAGISHSRTGGSSSEGPNLSPPFILTCGLGSFSQGRRTYGS